MESKGYKRAIGVALDRAGFERVGPAWTIEYPELRWIVEVEKGRRGWHVLVGVAMRAADSSFADRQNGCDISVGYELLGEHVPPAAARSRFDDHKSYFTMCLEPGHEHVSDQERLAAFEFLASDVAGYAAQIQTLDELAAALETHLLQGAFVSLKARALTAPP